MIWPLVRLADHCQVITKGTTPTTFGISYADSGIPFLRVQNIEGGTVNYDKDTLFIDGRTHHTFQRSQIHPGDVLVSIAGSIGRAGVVPDDAPELNCNQAVAIVRADTGVFRPFLRHWLESSVAQAQMRGATVTGTISNLSLTQLGNLQFPLPPLPEQRRIADTLDRAEELRAKRRAALVQLDMLAQSVFFDTFGDPATNPKGWATSALGDVLSAVYRYPTYYDITYVEQGIPEVRGELIQEDGGIITLKSRLRYISPVTSTRFPLTVLAEGDLVMSVRGTVGKVGIVPASLAGANMTANLIRMAPNRSIIDPVFTWHFMQTASFKERLTRACSSTTILTIKAPDLKRLVIPVPPLPLQHHFARHIGAIRELGAKNRSSLADMDALFASLQHRAFRGEL